MVFLGIQLEKARRQAAAVKFVERIGGFVVHTDDLDANGLFLFEDEKSTHFDNLIASNLLSKPLFLILERGTSLDVETMDAICELTDLEAFQANGVDISGEQLKRICRLKKLALLDLAESTVTDDDIAYFVKLPNLQVLDLSRTSVTRDGLVRLRACRSLRELRLDGLELTWDDRTEISKLLESVVVH